MESQEPNEEQNDGPDGTAPDSSTQSSASSSRGTRMTDDHLAPNDPAEGPVMDEE